MSTEVKVPTLGESITEATLGQWLKKPGEAVAADEPIASLETDKVAVEVPAPAAGVMGALTGQGRRYRECRCRNRDDRSRLRRACCRSCRCTGPSRSARTCGTRR